jgi:hypothetical protein
MEELGHPNIPRIVEQYIAELPPRSGKDGRIWPSDLGVSVGGDGPCQVAFWLKCRDEPTRAKKPGEYLMLEMGNHVHVEIANLITEAVKGTGWKVCGRELTCIDDYGGEEVRGRYDILLEHEDGRYHIIDIKTKRGKAFQFLNEAKPGDVLQVQWYMKSEGACTGSILYVDREGQNFMREFAVDRDDAAVEEAVAKLQEIRDNEMPPPTLTLKVSRNYNKGADSFKVEYPWQIQWCDLEGCACRKALPVKTLPKGIAGKLFPIKGEEDSYEVKLTKEGDGLRPLVMDLLANEFPNERFTLSSEVI